MASDDERADVLLQMKAGLLLPQQGKLVPDTRKGLIKITQLDDFIVQLQWLVRAADGSVADSNPQSEPLFLTPQISKCEFVQVGNPKSRCYSFRLDGKDTKFFWLQEPNLDADASRLGALNAAVSGEADSDMADAMPPESLAGMLAQGGQPQHSTGFPASQAHSSSAAVGAADLASILGNIMGGAPGNPADTAAMQAYMRGMAKAPGPGLGEILTPEVILPLLHGTDVLERLQEHLPPQHRNYEGLISVASSPHFQQQLETFSHALQTGQLDLSQFGLDVKGFTVAEFLESIEESVDKPGDHKGDGAAPPGEGQ
mmetsp:Transcript_14135/g.40053  ORF Transcript_14135/g.40053 Transcript_14135/m.40053 type:complete len:314 (-) Transcript_14135:83-1024(-)